MLKLGEIDETQAPLLEHLVELRTRLVRAVFALGVAFFICLYFADDIFGFLVRPLTEAFPPGERGRALGAIGSIVSIGIVIGPTAGGLILGSFSWHWIFLVNLPVGIAGIWLVLRFVPVDVPQRGSGSTWPAESPSSPPSRRSWSA